MVSAAKAFEKEPPTEDLDNLGAIVRDFQWRYVDRKKTDQVIAFCADAPDFPTAVQRAVEARDANGKHHNHQSKVDITARRKFGRKIIKRAEAGRLDLSEFDAFHDALNDIKPYGIGPVTVYDTAIRIAAFLDISPRSVYMHAGVRQGFKALQDAEWRRGLSDESWHSIIAINMSALDGKVPVSEFPHPLNGMAADDVEDILCTYREVFESW
jgi:hypothetical protein